MLSEAEIEQLAGGIAGRVKGQLDIRDIALSGVMGPGAIPLYGRETRKEPCSCCLIDPGGPNSPENRMCTTSGAIGTLKDSEEMEWCSKIELVSDGRCERAMKIREAAAECKEKYPGNTAKFFECYTPAFGRITGGANSIKEAQKPKREDVEIKLSGWTGEPPFGFEAYHKETGEKLADITLPEEASGISEEEALDYLESRGIIQEKGKP